MRGGRKTRRDRWFGLEDKPDFADFRHWWHREGKDESGGFDLGDREDAERAYEEWAARGRPTVK